MRVTREHHVMRRAGVNETGAEEWVCPHCGHRLELRLRPVLQVEVLAMGDAWATHCGGLNRMAGGPLLLAAESSPFAATEDLPSSGGANLENDQALDWLRPWLKALNALEDEGLSLPDL